MLANKDTDKEKGKALNGLTSAEVIRQREMNGVNKGLQSKSLLLQNILSVATEPMFILLLAACCVYFILQEISEAVTMLAAILFVAGIDVFQNFRSQKAVKALSRITESKTKVVRNGETVEIPVEDVVPQDIIICEEGVVVPADAEIISSNDFSVNEAILTGESVSIEKFEGDAIMQGTLVVRGYSYAKVKAVGKQTVLSGIGALVATTGKEKTPLQIKVSKFVKVMVIVGGIAFAFVWAYNWWESRSVLHGLLHGLTMAMSVLPEEIPVAFSTFMALGAYRLLRNGVIARSPKTVETLGSATVICLDKTGTLTQNLMKVSNTYTLATKNEIDFNISAKASEVLEYAMWASEETPFDPMEKSIHQQYSDLFNIDKRVDYRIVKEFPLSGTPPVMTHIFKSKEGNSIISCKGALEGVLNLCSLSQEQRIAALRQGEKYAQEGLRVLGVAKGNWGKSEHPNSQEDIQFTFLGIIAFYDPPAPEVSKVIQGFYNAGVDVKMITGDYPETALAIARKTGFRSHKMLTGKELSDMNANELRKAVTSTNIFARVSPEIKLKIINALKQAGEIVAMTGDGVNDAPALKSAHIGIAMGKRGTEVAKGAAGLVLSGDNLANMIDAIFIGRRISENLTKAFRYIISIHIPIILLVMLPIFLPWLPAMLFAPIHVIFLELIMGPTCSVIYENEPTPVEELKKPIRSDLSIIKSSQLFMTILQGVMITLGCIIAGWFAIQSGFEETKLRSCIFSTLVLSNIFLTLINRSSKRSIFKTMKMRNNLIPLIISLSFLLLILILYIPYLNRAFYMAPLKPVEFLLPIFIAFTSTFWFEIVKYFKNHPIKNRTVTSG